MDFSLALQIQLYRFDVAMPRRKNDMDDIYPPPPPVWCISRANYTLLIEQHVGKIQYAENAEVHDNTTATHMSPVLYEDKASVEDIEHSVEYWTSLKGWGRLARYSRLWVGLLP